MDVLIESIGGAADVAIRINDVLRETNRDLNVLVPRRAFSAATMLALGAKQIVMHPYACLGPIDPQLQMRKPDGTVDSVAVEDIRAFVEFLTDEAGISDQREIAAVFSKLLDGVPPTALGVARRSSKRAVEIAKELLLRHVKEGDAQAKVSSIAERLAGGYHEHGHPISATDARSMGLPVEVAKSPLREDLWALVLDADEELKTNLPHQTYMAGFKAWSDRRARWKRDYEAKPAQALDALDAEFASLQQSFQAPVDFEMEATVGLVESARGADRCVTRFMNICSVTPAGVKVFGGPPSVVWETTAL